MLSSFGRVMSITKRAARRLPIEPAIVELDVSNQDDLDALAERVGGRLDGVVHSIAFAPPSCLGGGFLDAPWEDVAVALQVSAYSLKALAVAALPLMGDGGAIVGFDFDSTRAFPVYDWMGVAKSALQSVSRFLARDLGPRRIRVNLVAAGPSRSLAARSIPGYEVFEDVWNERAPLGWDTRNAEPDRDARASPSSRTGSRPPRARSSTSTAGSTPSAPEAPPSEGSTGSVLVAVLVVANHNLHRADVARVALRATHAAVGGDVRGPVVPTRERRDPVEQRASRCREHRLPSGPRCRQVDRAPGRPRSADRSQP